MNVFQLGARLFVLESLVVRTCAELAILWREDISYLEDIEIEVGVSFELFEIAEVEPSPTRQERYHALDLPGRFLQFYQHVFPTAIFNGRNIGRSGVVFAWISYQMSGLHLRLTGIKDCGSSDDHDQLARDIDGLQSLILGAAMESGARKH